MSFDIERAAQIIRNYRLDIIKKYYPESHRRAYAEHRIPEVFEPKYWVNTSDTVVFDLARLVRYALDEADKSNIVIDSINHVMRYFEDYCIIEKGMLFHEIEKVNDILSNLIHGEYDSLDAKFTETTRLFLDIWLDIILNKQKALERYENEKESVWELIRSAGYLNEPSVNDYLLRRLAAENSVRRIDDLIDALGENGVTDAFKVINERITEHILDDISTIYTVLSFCRDIQSVESIDLLKRVENDYKTKNSNSDKFNPEFEVAFCKLEKGEKGLLDLYRCTSDYKVKLEVIDCYKYYRSKDFASILVEAMADSYRLENGHYPIRCCASIELSDESFLKLMEWFGYDIMDKVCKTVNETLN